MSRKLPNTAAVVLLYPPHEKSHPLIKFIAIQMSLEGMGRAELCRKSGVSVHTFRDWWKGKGNPTIWNLEAVLQVFGYTVKPTPLIKVPEPVVVVEEPKRVAKEGKTLGRPKKLSEEAIKVALALRAQGYSQDALARHFNVTRGAIRPILKAEKTNG